MRKQVRRFHAHHAATDDGDALDTRQLGGIAQRFPCVHHFDRWRELRHIKRMRTRYGAGGHDCKIRCVRSQRFGGDIRRSAYRHFQRAQRLQPVIEHRFDFQLVRCGDSERHLPAGFGGLFPYFDLVPACSSRTRRLQTGNPTADD